MRLKDTYKSLTIRKLTPPTGGNKIGNLLFCLPFAFVLFCIVSGCEKATETEAPYTEITRSVVDSTAADSTRRGVVLGDTTWADTIHISYDSLSIDTGDTITDGDADEAAARRNKE